MESNAAAMDDDSSGGVAGAPAWPGACMPAGLADAIRPAAAIAVAAKAEAGAGWGSWGGGERITSWAPGGSWAPAGSIMMGVMAWGGG